MFSNAPLSLLISLVLSDICLPETYNEEPFRTRILSSLSLIITLAVSKSVPSTFLTFSNSIEPPVSVETVHSLTKSFTSIVKISSVLPLSKVTLKVSVVLSYTTDLTS